MDPPTHISDELWPAPAVTGRPVEQAPPPDPRADLRADCGRCAALCCVGPAFVASADFAIDKPAAVPCPNLLDDLRCGIHDDLRGRGFPGCAVFDCFGAGQQVVQVAFSGRGWREDAATASTMFDVFTVMRQLRELLWYLVEAHSLVSPGALRDAVERWQERIEGLSLGGPAEVERIDARALRQEVGTLLSSVSDVFRAGSHAAGPDRRGQDLIEADLRAVDLRGVSLRGAYLLGADLRGADLRRADLLGADLRVADLRGADLTESIFLTQPQVQAARGDTSTGIPPWLVRPAQWPAGPTTVRRRSRSRPAAGPPAAGGSPGPR